jgi:pseudouridine synthase
MPDPKNRHDFTDANRGERLQRVLADAGIGSRRACEQLIEAGEVEVNGKLVAELPAWVDPAEDRIVVQGRPVPRPERRLYVLLNKPARTLSTMADEPGADRRTVTDLVDHPGSSRLFPVGRLDYDTVGLILLTNDGELANRLTHPRYGVPKTYRVVVKGLLGEEAVAELEQGIYLAERKAGQAEGAKKTARVEIKVISQNRENTTLEITLREGRNRQVRRMLAAVGYPVRKLESIGMGPIQLKGVARGAWRELTRDEIWALKGASSDSRGNTKSDVSDPEAGDKAPRSKPWSQGEPTRARGAKKGAKKAGRKPGRAQSYEPPPLDPGLPIRRRTMKNAINRATKGEITPALPATPKPEAQPAEDKPVRRSEPKTASRKPGPTSGSGTGGRPAAKGPARSGPKPGPRAGSREDDRPNARPGSRSESRPGGKPGDKRAGKSGEGPASRPGPRPGGKASGRPGAKPDAKSGGKPGGRAGNQPGGRPGPTDRRRKP